MSGQSSINPISLFAVLKHWNLSNECSAIMTEMRAFLLKSSNFFERDPRLLWNTDESQLNAMKRFKVICEILLVTVVEQVPQRTGMVTISGGGVVLEPLIILKSPEAVECAAGPKTPDDANRSRGDVSRWAAARCDRWQHQEWVPNERRLTIEPNETTAVQLALDPPVEGAYQSLIPRP
jgi:hypothetical protein